MSIKRCKKCKGDDFIINEMIIHEAALCPIDKDLTVYKEEAGGIITIVCKKCHTEYSEYDFKMINFR